MQYIHIIFVFDEELKGTYKMRYGRTSAIFVYIFVLANADVNVRTHLLRKQFSRNFRLIRSKPWTFLISIPTVQF